MKKLLWIGSFMDKRTNEIMISQGYKNASSYLSQKNLIEGIEMASGLVFDSLNAIVMAGYPKQGNIKMRCYEYSHIDGAKDILVGYVNLLYLNRYFMKKSMIKAAKKWIKERYQEQDQVEIFVYEMRSACIDAAVYLKKKIPAAKIHLIIPDLPCFMDLNMSRFKKRLKQIDWKQMLQKFNYIDDYIPYTETMVDYLNIRNKKWMVSEGSLNKKDIEKIISESDCVLKCEKSDKNIVMYSGWIDQQYGVDKLVDAMEYLDDTYELWITGGGSYADNLKEKVLGNRKVKYYGFLPNRTSLLELQKQASIMMNIRNPEIEAAHFCFPSKLFEYMLLGIPVISVKLRGIPKEYKQYLFELSELKPKIIARTIEDTMKNEEKKNRAEAGKKFVIKEKNNIAVGKKILEFIGN